MRSMANHDGTVSESGLERDTTQIASAKTEDNPTEG